MAALFICGGFSGRASALYESWKLGTRIKGTEYFVRTPHKDFGDATISQMNSALYEWNKYLPTGVKGIRREPTLRHTLSNYDKPEESWGDGRSLIYRQNLGYYDGAVGVTRRPKKSGIISEADMCLNTYYDFANSGLKDHFDVWSVFLHEAGHIFGFNDMDQYVYSQAVMCSHIDPGTEKRSITVTEQKVLQDIYK